MLILSENLRYLRAQLKYSQQKIADELLITRQAYAKYEEGGTNPPLEILIKISKYYKVSIDLLVLLDVRKFQLEELKPFPKNRVIFPILVDSTGENKIEIIPYKAKMGYLNGGYSDPGYFESLQYFSIPFLRNGKYRAFPAEGDSMPPYNDDTYFIGKLVEKIQEMKVGKTYLFITNTDFVYKRLEEINQHSVTVSSNNTFYQRYEIPFHEMLEIWQYAYSISKQELSVTDLANNDVKGMFLSLKEDILRMENQIKRKSN